MVRKKERLQLWIARCYIYPDHFTEILSVTGVESDLHPQQLA